ncbi:serine hydrolase [Chitinophaga horti]|uniref:Serine hydrolase n=1 Tax=Chitinophaga horti TaxID=2920382 RepID=A0ABY6J9X4_9BACT|nr:serine hydrolase [Chitinophaga horti]UYQ94974.1 serine hydrolase [Chitinophaga horti]
MKKLLLSACVVLSTTLPSFCQVKDFKTIDNGGTGPYKAIAASEATLPQHVVYRPKDMTGAAKANGPLPVIAFGNGGCFNSSIETERMLSDIASHGYVIIAIGPLVKNGVQDRTSTPASMLTDAINWVSRTNNKDYKGNVDTNRIAVMGHSCGGAQTMFVSADPRVKTSVLFNAGMGDMKMAGADRTSLSKLHHPILYMIGGPTDIAYKNAELDYERIQHVPVSIANLDVGHAGTFAKEYGGAFSGMAKDWLDWQLKGRNEKSTMFLADSAKLTSGWQIRSKNFVSTSAKTAAMDSLLRSFVDQGKVSCVAAFVAKGGKTLYHNAQGYKDLERKTPASPQDYYILFSQTKAVTTVAFMTLVERGLVKVDDPVSKYFPGIPDSVVIAVENGNYKTRPVKTPMTFAHLMSHSSGIGAGLAGQLRRAAARPGGATAGGQRTADASMNARYLKDDMLALAKYPLGFDPGSEWNYHVSTNMLAYMVEVISGKPLRQYVKETILGPLEMNDTDWYFEPGRLARFVKAYSYADGKLEAASNRYSEGTVSPVQTYCEGAIGLNGPIADYAKFCQMLLNKGEWNGRRILKPETVTLMTTVNQLPEQNGGGKGFQFGLGFELYNAQKKPVPEVSNTAFAWGGLYGTEYIIDPENDMIALFYLNMPKRDRLYPVFLSKAYQLFK